MCAWKTWGTRLVSPQLVQQRLGPLACLPIPYSEQALVGGISEMAQQQEPEMPTAGAGSGAPAWVSLKPFTEVLWWGCHL